jgi:hypothetical protein
MGRYKKYFTVEEQIAIRRKRQMEYYWRNKENINEKNLERYYKNKISGSIVFID